MNIIKTTGSFDLETQSFLMYNLDAQKGEIIWIFNSWISLEIFNFCAISFITKSPRLKWRIEKR